MGFKLCSVIEIGDYGMRGGVYQVNIKRSVKEIVDTAKIEVPAIGAVNDNGNLPDSSIVTSKLFNPGDKVVVQLGYNNQLKQEFKGFVRRVTPTIPVQIECEGYAFQLRRKRLIKSWKSVSLKQVLTEMVAGTDIILSPNIPVYTLTNLCFNHANCLKSLEYIKNKIHLAVFFMFETMYVGLEEGIKGNKVQYRLGWNTIRDDKLKYRLAADTEVLVRLVTGKGKNHKRTLIEVGDQGGGLVERNINNIRDMGNLQAIAADLLAQSKYTGYEGFITAFLQPYCQPGDTTETIDRQYNERGGDYFTEGTEVDFGIKTKGATRKIHIGRALSAAHG
jgi:hypothetical protein